MERPSFPVDPWLTLTRLWGSHPTRRLLPNSIDVHHAFDGGFVAGVNDRCRNRVGRHRQLNESRWVAVVWIHLGATDRPCLVADSDS